MTFETPETPQMRSITVEIPTIIAQKMAETFEGTLEDATLTGLKLLHGMGMPAYNKLQALAKQREMSVPKALRAAVDAMETAVLNGKAPVSGVIGRPKINEARDIAIYNQIASGRTYAEVASTFHVSLVRVGQIVAQQRAMRGINPQTELLRRNEEILRRVNAGENRVDVAASLNVSRSVVDYLMTQSKATQPRPTRVLPKVLSLKESEETVESLPTPTEQPKPRYVMPGLQPRSVEPDDGLTAVERNVVDPEFGF
jgi:DNA-binding CsgD family transcriptional regulator